MKKFYLLMCVLGTLFPLSFLVSWVAENGFQLDLLFSEIVNYKISAFAWADVLVSALVLIGFIVYEAKRIGMQTWWLAILATCCVGVSLGLPLFLYMRERHLETALSDKTVIVLKSITVTRIEINEACPKIK